MTRASDFLRSDWLAIRVQLALGAVFLVASLPKLKSPPIFAKNIHAYAILPDALVNVMALLLPGIELVAGLCLIFGLLRRPAAAAIAAMLAVFIVALSWNIAVGNPVNCSCFEVTTKVKTCAELLSDMKQVILRDVGLLLLATHVLWLTPPKKRECPDSGL